MTEHASYTRDTIRNQGLMLLHEHYRELTDDLDHEANLGIRRALVLIRSKTLQEIQSLEAAMRECE